MIKARYFHFIIAGLLTFSACSKEETPSTGIELSLTDNLGNVVSGASVKLFSSQTDWKNKTNQIGATQTSDASGKVRFKDLSNIKYYWFAEKDCQNNANGTATTLDPITANKITSLTVPLSSTGTLKFVSTSNNPYRIFINGTAMFDMNGGTTKYYYYAPVGNYSLRVLQLSGYLISPTDKSYTGNVGCGQTLSTTFP
jgi:hypothetical protein